MKKSKKLLKWNKFFFVIIVLNSLVLFTKCEFIYELGNETFNPENHPLIEEGDTLIFIGGSANDSLLVTSSKVYEPHEYDDAQYYKY